MTKIKIAISSMLQCYDFDTNKTIQADLTWYFYDFIYDYDYSRWS